MNVEIDGRKFNVIIKNKNVKYSNLKIRQNDLIITSFQYLTEEEALMFINRNINAIRKLIKKVPQNPVKDDEFLLFGKIYKLNIYDGPLLIKDDSINVSSVDKIYEFAFGKVYELFMNIQNSYFKNTPSILKFKRMKTRWGVCYLKKATIALTIPIIHLPIDVIEYVIIHEFCHFKYPNHSKDFYNYVSKYCPNYKKIVKKLKSFTYVM